MRKSYRKEGAAAWKSSTSGQAKAEKSEECHGPGVLFLAMQELRSAERNYQVQSRQKEALFHTTHNYVVELTATGCHGGQKYK